VLLLEWRPSEFAAGETASRLYRDEPITERGWKRSAASSFSCFSYWFGVVFFTWWCRPPSFRDKDKNPDIETATIKMEPLALAKESGILIHVRRKLWRIFFAVSSIRVFLSFRFGHCLSPWFIIYKTMTVKHALTQKPFINNNVSRAPLSLVSGQRRRMAMARSVNMLKQILLTCFSQTKMTHLSSPPNHHSLYSSLRS